MMRDRPMGTAGVLKEGAEDLCDPPHGRYRSLSGIADHRNCLFHAQGRPQFCGMRNNFSVETGCVVEGRPVNDMAKPLCSPGDLARAWSGEGQEADRMHRVTDAFMYTMVLGAVVSMTFLVAAYRGADWAL
jgi:hypothetical protein